MTAHFPNLGIGFQDFLLISLDSRWTGDEGDNEDGFGNSRGNATFLEGAVATFLDSVPLQVPFSLHSCSREELPFDQPPPQSSLKLASQLRQIFEKTTSSEKKEEEEELNSGDEKLNLQRLPVLVYKFPVGKHSSFGDGYEGMETEVCL